MHLTTNQLRIGFWLKLEGILTKGNFYFVYMNRAAFLEASNKTLQFWLNEIVLSHSFRQTNRHQECLSYRYLSKKETLEDCDKKYGGKTDLGLVVVVVIYGGFSTG